MPWPHLADAFAKLPARYNLAPTQTAGVLIQPNAEIELARLRWGLLPFWAKELAFGSNTINARIESVDSKPSFRNAFKARHAVVPMIGYYEWQATPSGKQPYYFQSQNGAPLWIAGLWEPRHALQTDDSNGTFTLITQPADGLPATIHSRMPLYLDLSEVEEWLNLKAAASMPFLMSRRIPDLHVQAVSKRVNAARDDDPELIQPVELGA